MERTISAMVGKGSLNHNNRTFVAKNVDENRIRNNVCYVKKSLKKLYHELFDEAVEEYNAKQKRKDRRIDDYYEKIENGKQEKLFHELILQIGNKDDMSALNPEDVKLAKDIFSEYVEAFQERNPNLVVFNAVLHLDEATPHVHIDYVPVMHNSKRGLRVRNSMKGALAELGFYGESKGSTEWSKWAESEKQLLAGIMKKFGIQWKQLGTHEKHLDVLDYKKKVRLQEVKELDEEIDRKSDTIMRQEDMIEEKQQQIENADIVLEISNRQISAAKDELDDIQTQAVTKEQEVKERNQQIKDADTILETKKIELDSMRNEVKHNQSKLVDVRREMTMEQSELRKVQDSVADYRKELQSLHDEVSYETVELKKVKAEKDLALDEIAATKAETEQLKKEQSDIIAEAEELIDQKARLEKAVTEAGKDVLSYNNSIAELDSPKWSLQEPAGFVSAKAFFKDIALPLVNSLKKWVRSLISYVKVLEGKVRELTEYKSWAEKKIRTQAEAEMKWQQEMNTLWKDLQDYNLLKIAFGPDRMYELLMEAIDIYYKEHGIPYEPVIDVEKDQKRR